MELSYPLFERANGQALAEFLTSEDWPYHAGPPKTQDSINTRIANGDFDSGHDRTYWIVADGTRVGMLHVEDLGDGDPLFDLRLRTSHRGQGLGTAAVRWLTATLFQEFPDLNRIGATTRQDNERMRHVLVRCGFAKEAHYRQGWPSESGQLYDSIGYGILRSDWVAGLTTPVNWDDGP